MKNILSTITATIILAGMIFLGSCSSSAESEAIPSMLERNVAVGTEGEQQLILKTYTDAKTDLEKNPGDLQQYIKLASAYISEGRVTGNSTYYNEAALKMLQEVLGSNTPDKDILLQGYSLRSAVLLNMHQFQAAKEDAEKGLALNSFYSGIYGSLIDANLELGNYDAAVGYCDKMLSIRPDLRSYSRASYLRQIFGQTKGAIQAMNMAVEASVPGEESTEWARTNLADLYLNNGNVDSAAIIYRTSLVYRPGYAHALIGLAKVEKAKKNYDQAIVHTRDAIKVLSDGAFVSLLAELYELKGDKAKAGEIRNDLVALLVEGEKEQKNNTLAKHNVSREMATAYMYAGKLDKALEFANIDLKMRPENIDANELAAWIYYLKGDYTNAKVHADKMLATNTANANTLYKAGVIYLKSGEPGKGNELVARAIAVNPNLDQRILDQGRAVASLIN
jgi:tetratricopeptide (TPR) repeat protein